MLRAVVLGGIALALSGCGGARGEEDFAITVQRPVSTAFTALGSATMPSEVRSLFPQLKIERTRPSDNEVLYTIPGDGEFPATIRFRFDGAADGKSTIVHGFVDVPPIKVNLAGKAMMLSESKVEGALNRYLQRVATEGTNSSWSGSPMPEVLMALAIATNSKTFTEVQEMQKDPTKFAERFAGLGNVFGGEGEEDAGDPTVSGAPQIDPNAEARRSSMAQEDRADEIEEAQLDASQPMIEVEGADVSPGGY